VHGLESTSRYKNTPNSYNRLYIRFIGDRTIQEKDFGKIQKDTVSEMKKWSRFVKEAREEQLDSLNLVIVAANNHYAGFDPGTANTFGKMLDLSEGNRIMLKCLQLKERLMIQNN
jgi:hypothetical protein